MTYKLIITPPAGRRVTMQVRAEDWDEALAETRRQMIRLAALEGRLIAAGQRAGIAERRIRGTRP